MKPSDNLDRDKMYAGGGDDTDGDYELAPIEEDRAPAQPTQSGRKHFDDDDGAELELEPVDAAILEAAKRRADDAIVAATQAIDINKIYQEIEPDRELKLPTDLLKDIRFQFGIKHLLYATAGVAVLLTLLKLLNVSGVGDALVILFMLAVFAATAYFQVIEKKQQKEADRRRHEMYAARRAQAGYRRPEGSQYTDDSPEPGVRGLSPEDYARIAPAPPPTTERPPWRSGLSVGQWLAAGGCALILIWIVYAVGGPQNGAMLFGLMALGGLVAHALGYDPPEVVAFAWWLSLVLYIVLGVFTAIWHEIAG